MSTKYLCSVTIGECRVLSPLLVHYFQSVKQAQVVQLAICNYKETSLVSKTRKQFHSVAGVRTEFHWFSRTESHFDWL